MNLEIENEFSACPSKTYAYMADGFEYHELQMRREIMQSQCRGCWLFSNVGREGLLFLPSFVTILAWFVFVRSCEVRFKLDECVNMLYYTIHAYRRQRTTRQRLPVFHLVFLQAFQEMRFPLQPVYSLLHPQSTSSMTSFCMATK